MKTILYMNSALFSSVSEKYLYVAEFAFRAYLEYLPYTISITNIFSQARIIV